MVARILLVSAVVLGAGAVAASMSSQRHVNTTVAAILQADGVGTDPSADVKALASYVHGHLGTHAKFTLTASYQRAVTKAQAAAAAQSQNSQVYTAAQAACGGKTDSVTQARCVQAYVSQRLVNIPPAEPATQPQLAPYQYDLRAPWWTLDLAGWLGLSAIAAAAFGIIGLIRKRAS